MDDVIKHLSNIYSMDGQLLASYALCALLPLYALKDYLASPIFVIFAFPVLFILSVLVQYLFILGEFYPPRKLDQWLMWTIMASICGNIAGDYGRGMVQPRSRSIHHTRKLGASRSSSNVCLAPHTSLS